MGDTSWASSPGVRRQMQGNRSTDTRPELLIRSRLHAMGLRYRLGVMPLAKVRRTPDIIFPAARVAVFVDGCFWHGCPSHYRPPRTNASYWATKIARNRARDKDTDDRLHANGWHVIRIWEHDAPEKAADAIASIVWNRRDGRARSR